MEVSEAHIFKKLGRKEGNAGYQLREDCSELPKCASPLVHIQELVCGE